MARDEFGEVRRSYIMQEYVVHGKKFRFYIQCRRKLLKSFKQERDMIILCCKEISLLCKNRV